MNVAVRRTGSPLALGVVLLLTGCNFAPDGDAPMTAPPEYREWFSATEACSGRTGNFDRIVWHVVEGESFDCPSGRCVGRWNDNHHIYIASAYQRNELVVRHEMLHALLQTGAHPTNQFVEACHLASTRVWRDSTLAADPGNPSGR